MPAPTKIKQSPSLTLDGNEMNDHSRRAVITSTRDTDGATFKRPFGSAFAVEIEVFQSFGADGFETIMRPLVNTIVEAVYSPKDGEVASVANPHLKCQVRIPPFDFINSGIDEFSPFSMTLPAEEGTTEKSVDGTTWTAI